MTSTARRLGVRSAPLVLALALAVVAAGLVGCVGGGDGGQVALDGSPRVPDVEGVLESASREAVVIDGVRYRLADDAEVFNTNTLEPVPLLERRNQWVQAGVRDDTVRWLAVFGAVATFAGRPRVTYYTGVFVRVEDDRAVFADGTTLRLGEAVTPPDDAEGAHLVAEVDADRDEARSLLPAR